MADPRWNVLWICADDLAAYALGAYGDALSQTPRIDRLAAEGVRFDRAFCACPLSTPSRQSFLTGRYPRSVGVTLTPTPLPDDEITIGSRLRREGYESLALGKTHFYFPLFHEFDTCIDLDEYQDWLAEKGPTPLPVGARTLGPWRPFGDPAAVWLNAEALPYPAVDADMSSTYFAQSADRFLRERDRDRERDRPFFLLVNLYEPHSPFRFPVEFQGRFDPSLFDVPKVDPEEFDRVPPVFRGLTEAQKRGIIAAYHTSVAFVDQTVGRILDALENAGRGDDTLVIFNSDHGSLLGQHGRFEKHCCYEEAVRAALIVRTPGMAASARGRGCEALVELIDVVPTILDLCGASAPEELPGRSLGPLLRGETDRHRDVVFAEYADNAEGMVRNDRWKLIYGAGHRIRRDGYALSYSHPPGRSVELFDLAADPGEHTNVAGRPEHAEVVAELTDLLLEHLRATARDPARLKGPGDVHAELARALWPTELGLPANAPPSG